MKIVMKFNNLLKAISFVIVLGVIATAGNVVVRDGDLNITDDLISDTI